MLYMRYVTWSCLISNFELRFGELIGQKISFVTATHMNNDSSSKALKTFTAETDDKIVPYEDIATYFSR